MNKEGPGKVTERKSPASNYLTPDSQEEWDAALTLSTKTGAPLVVDFTASWCKPCKAIAPFYKSLPSEYDALFVTVDVDELDEVAQTAKVSMMPTFAVYEGGKQVEKMAGADEVKLEAMVGRYCGKF